MTTLKITLTKEIYERAKMCGFIEGSIIETCAIALAIRDVFPNAKATSFAIEDNKIGLRIPHSKEVLEFIDLFDCSEPHDRLLLPEFSFTVELPDEVVERIDISDVEKSLTLELV